MQKITPHLWFNTNAEEAVRFYTSLFSDSSIGAQSHYGKAGRDVHGMPEGMVMTTEFTVAGRTFIALNGGPHFTFNPAISFIVGCETVEEVDRLWDVLIDDGTALMPIDTYPFSTRYGWVQDKFGVSWQIMHTSPEGDRRPTIVPALLFVNELCGKAEEAMRFYLSVFKNAQEGQFMKYGEGQEPNRPGTVMFEDFMLEGEWFAAMDGALTHDFAFNEAISFLVSCETQDEIDHYWEKLSAVPEAAQCGWLKDKYGVSWQIVPRVLNELTNDPDREKAGRVIEAMLKMKKLDITKLEAAFNG